MYRVDPAPTRRRGCRWLPVPRHRTRLRSGRPGSGPPLPGGRHGGELALGAVAHEVAQPAVDIRRAPMLDFVGEPAAMELRISPGEDILVERVDVVVAGHEDAAVNAWQAHSGLIQAERVGERLPRGDGLRLR